MKSITIKLISILFILSMVHGSTAQTVTKHDGEYASDQTIFEYELLFATDTDGWLGFYWSFNETGDQIRFEIGKSVLSEDYIDVFYDGVYKIPMDIYVNNAELDPNADEFYFDYWEGIFWNSFYLPIEDGQYNVFDQLEAQDPATWDVKTDEVSFFNTQNEFVYDYDTGVVLNWTSTIGYDFQLSNMAPQGLPGDDEDSDGFNVPFNTYVIFIALTSLTLIKKRSQRSQ